MPSLDGYSLNEKIDKLHLEVKEDIVRLREEFTELYKYMQELRDKESRVEAKKETKSKANKKEKASAKKA
tara:strand:- start:429 stop:638 length:210 start_codon:yes stop_codon:yes gene_type:complete